MGKFKYLVIHCTLTPPSLNVTKEVLEQWHIKENGWSRLGYSDIIKRNGLVENLTPYNEDNEISNSEMTWGAKGVNKYSRHVVLEGGMTADGVDPGIVMFEELYTDMQFYSLETYIQETLSLHPNIKVVGHYHFNDHKTCPNFNLSDFLTLINQE